MTKTKNYEIAIYTKITLWYLFMDRAHLPQDCWSNTLQNVNIRPQKEVNNLPGNQDQYYCRHMVSIKVAGPPPLMQKMHKTHTKLSPTPLPLPPDHRILKLLSLPKPNNSNLPHYKLQKYPGNKMIKNAKEGHAKLYHLTIKNIANIVSEVLECHEFKINLFFIFLHPWDKFCL